MKRAKGKVLRKRDDGLSRSTFDRYVAAVKRAVIFRVPLTVAERATTQALPAARRTEDS